MILKSADVTRDVAELEALKSRGDVTATQMKNIERTAMNVRAGNKAEQDAAYQINYYYGASLNWLVFHDLRIEYKGLTAQIDHLLINRFFDFWLCETKRFVNGIAINDHGEFVDFYDREPRGISSPIEQNKRHIKIVRQLLDDGVIKLPRRLGMTIKPNLRSLVLVSNNAQIMRPKAKVEGVDTVVKTDQLRTTIVREYDKSSALDIVKLTGRLTFEAFGREILALHRPKSRNWASQFGLGLRRPPTEAAVDASMTSYHRLAQPSVCKAESLVCGSCNVAISAAVVRFCLDNPQRFSGVNYCMRCQQSV